MDTVGSSMIQNPASMSHEQLPLSLNYDVSYAMPPGLDAAALAGISTPRRPSKAAPGRIVKRSASTPNVRSLSTGSDPTMSLSEKRRNKLGYHRTSVACVHCRRRKIRCLLAPDDQQNRCSNCIRLKKECNFFPVDQQPPNERRPRTGSKMDSKGSTGGGGSGSDSSSPNVTGRSGEQSESFNHFQHLPQSAHAYGNPMMTIGSSGMSPPGSAGMSPLHERTTDWRLISAVHEQPQGVGWDPRFFEGQQMPSAQASVDEHGNAYWKVPETPMTPFSPYSAVTPGGHGSYPPYSAGARPDSAHHQHHPWPMRSMSYSGIDEGPARHDSYPGAHTDMRRSTIDMPPPSLHSNASTSTSASMGSEVPGIPSSQSMLPYGMPQSWSMLPTQSPKAVEFGAWYADPNPLAKVQEEDPSQFGDMQGGMYQGGGGAQR